MRVPRIVAGFLSRLSLSFSLSLSIPFFSYVLAFFPTPSFFRSLSHCSALRGCLATPAVAVARSDGEGKREREMVEERRKDRWRARRDVVIRTKRGGEAEGQEMCDAF